MNDSQRRLFTAQQNPIDSCPECGADTVIRHSKSGPFIGCSQYPNCQFTRPLNDHQVHTVKLLDNPSCPQCQAQLAVKNGRFGMFIGCTNFPECNYIANMNAEQDTGVTCPKCTQGQLLQRSNRYGKTFFACNAYPKCKYTVKLKPVARRCPQCDWPILVEKKTATGVSWQCPQKSCDYQLVNPD